MIERPVYEYIKGHKVKMEEHMLSATELASMYGLYTNNNNPNGLLISCILSDYVTEHGMNVSEYYYPHGKGVMRVYPELIYKQALNEFTFMLNPGDRDTYYMKSEKKKVNYLYKPHKNGCVIPIERRTMNGRSKESN